MHLFFYQTIAQEEIQLLYICIRLLQNHQKETKGKYIWKQTLNAQNLLLVLKHKCLLLQAIYQTALKTYSSQRSVSRFIFLAQMSTNFLQTCAKASLDEQEHLRSIIQCLWPLEGSCMISGPFWTLPRSMCLLMNPIHRLYHTGTSKPG